MGLVIGLLAAAALCAFLFSKVDWAGIIADPSALDPPKPQRDSHGRFVKGHSVLPDRGPDGRFIADPDL